MNEYGNFIRRADLIKNLIARQQLDEETATSKPNKAVVDANKQRWLKYQELLRDSLTARIAAANSTGGGTPDGGGNGALTTAWITATGETDTTIISALNTLETDLTTYGLTAKIKALYPMVGGSAAKHKFNFLDARDLDDAFRLTFSGGWTHASTGATPNGTNAYADTKLNPFTQSLSINSAHVSYYRRNVSTGTLIGSLTNISGTVLRFTLTPDYGGGYGNISEIISTNAQQQTTAITELGLINGNRNSSTAFKIFANATLKQTVTRTSVTQPSNTFYIGANHEGGAASAYNSGECAFASIGSGLTDTEAANLYTAVQNFNTTLSRQV